MNIASSYICHKYSSLGHYFPVHTLNTSITFFSKIFLQSTAPNVCIYRYMFPLSNFQIGFCNLQCISYHNHTVFHGPPYICINYNLPYFAIIEGLFTLLSFLRTCLCATDVVVCSKKQMYM